MVSIFIIFLLWIAFSSQQNCGKDKLSRFDSLHVKGRNATIDYHPWMTAIKKPDGSLHCGGSLTSRNTAVSAAHCFIDKSTGKKLSTARIQAFRVILGSSNPFESTMEINEFQKIRK